MNRDGQAGGQHHMGSARLAQEAFRVAADPTRFPEQLKAGLRPWQARKVYQAVSYTHLRAHETVLDLVCRLLLEKKKKPIPNDINTVTI